MLHQTVCPSTTRRRHTRSSSHARPGHRRDTLWGPHRSSTTTDPRWRGSPMPPAPHTAVLLPTTGAAVAPRA